MKKILLSSIMCFALIAMSFGQINVLDFESVQDAFLEPFDLKSFETAVANPDKTAPNTSDFVGKAIKQIDEDGGKWWGGTNIRLGGDIDLTGSDEITIDCYAAQSGINDTIILRIEVVDEFSGNATVAINGYYTDANDTEIDKWKTITYDISGLSGTYTKLVIFFNWQGYAQDGDVYYFDNVTLPGYDAFVSTDVTFNITDKFNNATDVSLFIDGIEETLVQTSNVYSVTKSLVPYNITVGETAGIYEVVYSHMAEGEEVRDTTDLVVGTSSAAQEVTKLILVEAEENGIAYAISTGSTSPTIDGDVDAIWSNAKSHALQSRSWWGTATGLYSYYKIMWDIDNVYVLCYVEDATPNNSIADAYNNDNVELFFDMNQSASSTWDADDWQIRTIRGLDTWTGSTNTEEQDWSTAERAQKEFTDGSGYIVEIAIPWSILSSGFLQIETAEFNFDISVADDASGGGRNYIVAWNTDADVNYNSTEKYGTVILHGETEPSSIHSAKVSNLSIYPNPVNDQLSITAGVAISSVNVFDITGRMVSSVNGINYTHADINVSSLNSGIYIVKVTDVEGNSTSSKIKIN
jgi:hypothetical protein